METIQAAPEAASPSVLSDEMPPSPQPSPAATPAPEKRFINAELEGHDKNEPLQVGETYTLAFDVDVQARASAVATDGFKYLFQTDEQLVELTVRLESKDFDIYSDPQKLRVPRTGKSKGKARFDISPKHNGEGVVNAIFLKDGNFIQLLTLKLNVGQPAKPAVLAAESLGRDLSTALVVQPRDVTLVIRNTGTGFDLIMLDAATTTAFVPVTPPELNQMIADARQALLDVVNYRSGATRQPDYQAGIDISPQANQFALARLSRAGFRLYRKIFYGPAAGADSNLIGDRLRQLAEGEATLKIHVSSQQFLLPWGMLYLAREYDPDHIDAKRFLGLRHMIEHLPLQRTQVPAHPLTMDSPSKLTISLNVNGDIDRQMQMPLIASQLTYWDGVQQTRGAKVIVRKTVPAVKQALADATTPDEILYFYCHASSKMLSEGGGPDTSTLLLSDEGRLTLGDLEDEAPIQKMLPNAPLVFINACESAELSPLFYDGFVPYFIAKGARGVIGTECSTPALFAAEWAKCFFDRFLTGEPLGQVFLGLRREFYESHNNLMGLLYALYCDGDTQVAKN
jgi:hypothetical protein